MGLVHDIAGVWSDQWCYARFEGPVLDEYPRLGELGVTMTGKQKGQSMLNNTGMSRRRRPLCWMFNSV